MQIIPFPRILGFAAASLSAQLWLSAAHAHLVVQVRGSAQLDADVDPASNATSDATVRGRLRDELGESIATAKVRFEMTQGQAPPAPLAHAKDCSARATAATTGIETDAEGRFCAQVPRAELPSGSSLRVNFDGTESYGGATTTITLDDNRSGLLVDFGQLAHVVNLDTGELAFVAELHPIAPTALRDSLPLSLELSLRTTDNGKLEERQLQRLQAKVATPVRVILTATQLGRPGLCDLVLVFDGNSSYKPFRTQYRMERTTSVKLTVADLPNSAIRGERLSITVRAASGANLPPPGFVELSGFDGNTELLPLQADGTAPIAIQIPRRPRVDFVSLRYQSSTPGWRAEAPLRLTLQLLTPSRWSLLGWVSAALLVLAWLGWSRRRDEPGAATAAPAPAPRPYAHLEIIESSRDPGAGWSGIVVDAHEGVTISGATVELYRPSFDRQERLFSTLSDELGRFEIPPRPNETDVPCRLELKADGYARIGLTIPPPGRIKVHLVSVRRAILDRLVAWTKRRGQPFDSKAEPTPDWVAEVARAKGHPAVEEWAKSVSLAAFGKTEPVNPERDDLMPPAGRVGSPAEAKRRDL